MRIQRSKFHNIATYAFLIFAIMSSCLIKEKEISILGFEQLKWKLDSLACNDYRFEHYEILQINKQAILGEVEKQVLKYLGNPNIIKERIDSKSFYYYITKGEQCLSHGGNKLKLTQNKVLEILFKDGKVNNIFIMVP